jgi:hypothetical protein
MPEQLTINGRTFVQAVNVIKRGNTRHIVPAYDNDGQPVFALPGGGRATEKELKNGLR